MSSRRLIVANSRPLYKSVDRTKMSVTAALTYPVKDRAGDYVKPDGIDWTLHKADPRVGFEHFRIGYDGSVLAPGDRGFNASLPMVTVGWASPTKGMAYGWKSEHHTSDVDGLVKSIFKRKDYSITPYLADALQDAGCNDETLLSRLRGTMTAKEFKSLSKIEYSVVLKSLPIDGKQVSIPVGTTYFDNSDRLSSQTFKLIEEDTLPGVSIEFSLIEGQYKAIGRSPLERRSAYEVLACDGLGYVHCKTPVNPGALIAKSITPSLEKAIRYAQTRKLGSEAIHPVLFKSFAALLPGKSSSVVSGFKAMDQLGMDPAAGMETAYEPPMEETDLEPEGPPTAKLCYELAQAIKDISDHGRGGVKSSEHIPAKKKTLSGLDKLDGMASFFLSLAQKIEADVGDEVEDIDLYDEEPGEETEAKEPEAPPAEDAPPPPDEGADEPEDEEDDEDKFKKAITDRTASGILAAIPARFHKSIRRFSLRELTVAPVVKSQPEPSPEPDPTDPEQFSAWLEHQKTHDPKGYREVKRALAESRWS